MYNNLSLKDSQYSHQMHPYNSNLVPLSRSRSSLATLSTPSLLHLATISVRQAISPYYLSTKVVASRHQHWRNPLSLQLELLPVKGPVEVSGGMKETTLQREIRLSSSYDALELGVTILACYATLSSSNHATNNNWLNSLYFLDLSTKIHVFFLTLQSRALRPGYPIIGSAGS
jgi:hypothetical protein